MTWCSSPRFFTTQDVSKNPCKGSEGVDVNPSRPIFPSPSTGEGQGEGDPPPTQQRKKDPFQGLEALQLKKFGPDLLVVLPVAIPFRV